jgi:hypothetical protein
MSLNPQNIDDLREWLGPDGAMAGLEKSYLTNADLMVLARACNVEATKKTPRKQLVIDIVMSPIVRIEKTGDELLTMSRDEIRRYLTEQFVSTCEIVGLLNDLGIDPKTKGKSKLVDFAASEISDLGAYQRIAQGTHKSR